MKSFAYQIKEELLQQNFTKAQLKSFVKGFILTAAKEDLDCYSAQLNNHFLLEHFFLLIKATFKVHIDNRSLIFAKDEFLLRTLNNHKIIYPQYFYGGVFFARGSISKKSSNLYHLEVSTYNKVSFQLITQELKSGRQPFVFSTLFYRNKYIAYLKNIESIITFLAAIGAVTSYFELQNIQIENDLRSTITKQTNLDVVNSRKIVQTSLKHIKNINYLYDNKLAKQFKKPELVFFKIKLEKPYLSLASIAEILQSKKIYVTKSGLNHWLRKLTRVVENHKMNTENDN